MNATSNKKYMNLIYHSYKFSIAVCSYDEFSLIFFIWKCFNTKYHWNVRRLKLHSDGVTISNTVFLLHFYPIFKICFLLICFKTFIILSYRISSLFILIKCRSPVILRCCCILETLKETINQSTINRSNIEEMFKLKIKIEKQCIVFTPYLIIWMIAVPKRKTRGRATKPQPQFWAHCSNW